jgi:hypothetical protein
MFSTLHAFANAAGPALGMAQARGVGLTRGHCAGALVVTVLGSRLAVPQHILVSSTQPFHKLGFSVHMPSTSRLQTVQWHHDLTSRPHAFPQAVSSECPGTLTRQGTTLLPASDRLLTQVP